VCYTRRLFQTSVAVDEEFFILNNWNQIEEVQWSDWRIGPPRSIQLSDQLLGGTRTCLGIHG
ncbi:hypothetical protein L9F63_011827, partial [Diploptera punctata]